MRIAFVAAMVLPLSLIGCAHHAAETPASGASTHAVLPASGLEQFFDESNRPFWKPEIEHIEGLQRGLRAVLRESADERAGMILEQFGDYRLQYVGITRDGRRAIAVSGFCRALWSDFPDWQTRLVTIRGGGTCFWGATCNPDTKECVGLSINARR